MARSDDRRSRPPVPAWLGSACEPVYRAAIALRHARFDRGWGVRGFALPVVSVGNLSVGGTGKTPMVAMVVRMLLDAGRRPGIVMRGYKSRRGEMGDEQREYVAMFGERVPIVADPDRRRAIRGLIERGGAGGVGEVGASGTAVSPDGASSGTGVESTACGEVDCVVLDDGFQHRLVRRDLDVVLIDATRDVFADRLLPRGWLREPVESLERAGVVVLTHAEALDEAGRERVWGKVRGVAPDAVCVEACHVWTGLRVIEKGEMRSEPVAWLAGRAVVVAPGIGNPTAFAAQARAAGAAVVDERFMPDHHHWTGADVRGLLEGSARDRGGHSCVLTTMKDWVKIEPLVRGLPDSGFSWCVPVLEMRVHRGAESLRNRLDEAIAGHRP